MTQEHPITPPSELLQEWINKHYGCEVHRNPCGVERTIATQSARWGADQELDACDKALRKIWQMDHVSTVDDFLRELRAARRPKPPSLKAQALAALETQFAKEFMESDERDIIRRAIESLPD